MTIPTKATMTDAFGWVHAGVRIQPGAIDPTEMLASPKGTNAFTAPTKVSPERTTSTSPITMPIAEGRRRPRLLALASAQAVWGLWAGIYYGHAWEG